MREILLWFAAIVIVGVVFGLIRTFVKLESSFDKAFRVASAILALLFVVLMLLAILRYAHVPLPW